MVAGRSSFDSDGDPIEAASEPDGSGTRGTPTSERALGRHRAFVHVLSRNQADRPRGSVGRGLAIAQRALLGRVVTLTNGGSFTDVSWRRLMMLRTMSSSTCADCAAVLPIA